MVRVRLNPALAPDDADDEVERVSTADKLRAVASCLPFGLIIFSGHGLHHVWHRYPVGSGRDRRAGVADNRRLLSSAEFSR